MRVLQFYHELKDELKDISPLPKFLVVKTIIFLSFWCVHRPAPRDILAFLSRTRKDASLMLPGLPPTDPLSRPSVHRQGLAIVGLAHEGFITSYMDYSTDDVASGIQDFLICLEMAMISYAHKFVFSYRDMEKIISKSHAIYSGQAIEPLCITALRGGVLTESRHVAP